MAEAARATQVKKGEILLEIETDKATMELEAYEAGVVEKVLVDEGQTVPIGQPIMLIGDGAGASAGVRRQETGDRRQKRAKADAVGGRRGRRCRLAAGTGEAPEPLLAAGRTEQPKQQRPAEPQRSYGYGFPAGETALAPGGGSASAAPPGRATAGQRRTARGERRGPGLADGPRGRPRARGQPGVGPGQRPRRPGDPRRRGEGGAGRRRPHRRDSRSAQPPASGRAERRLRGSRRPVQAGPDQEIEEIPLNNIRRITGRRMVESLQSAPHFFLTALIDVTDLLALRQQINSQLAEGERRVSVNDLIVKACALTLRAVPEANVSFAGDKILKKKRIHVGIAVPDRARPDRAR